MKGPRTAEKWNYTDSEVENCGGIGMQYSMKLREGSEIIFN
jgi:hypothetical protein